MSLRCPYPRWISHRLSLSPIITPLASGLTPLSTPGIPLKLAYLPPVPRPDASVPPVQLLLVIVSLKSTVERQQLCRPPRAQYNNPLAKSCSIETEIILLLPPALGFISLNSRSEGSEVRSVLCETKRDHRSPSVGICWLTRPSPNRPAARSAATTPHLSTDTPNPAEQTRPKNPSLDENRVG